MLKRVGLLLAITLSLYLVIQGFLISADRETPPVKFKEISAALGLKDIPSNRFGEEQIAWGDYNNDGYQDFILGGHILYRNSGPPDWKFEDVTDQVGLKTEGGRAAWADYDNDGNLDLLIFGKKKSLWRNSGPPDYKFTDVTAQAGDLNDGFNTCGVVWFDYDHDGYLDLYLVNYEEKVDKGEPDRLLHNEKGKFVDVTEKAGLGKEKETPLPGRSAALGDYNNDGRPDIYVSNYRLKPNYLWELQKDNTFKDVAKERKVAGINRQGYYGHTIASVFGDINNDGLLDLIVGNFAHKDTQSGRGYICDDAKIYLNLGPNEQYRFEDIRERAGIPIKGLDTGDETICGVALADFDNDGWLDLYLTQTYDELPWAYSFLYRNEGGKETHFKDITESAGVRVWDTYICTPVDFNNDGKVDLVTGGKSVQDKGAPHTLHFFRNDTANQNNWLHVKLTGKDCNKFGVGARLTIYYGDKLQIREITATTSNTSGSPLVAYFGLGAAKTIDRLEIRWPCGKVQKIDNPAINKILTVKEK